MIRAGIDQHQVSVRMAGGDGQRPPAPHPMGFLRGELATDMDAGEQLVVRLEIEFEDEIVVIVRRGEDAIGVAFGNGLANDAAVVHVKFGVTGFHRPTRKVLAVEEMDPPRLGVRQQRGEYHEHKKNQFGSMHNELHTQSSVLEESQLHRRQFRRTPSGDVTVGGIFP
jgi:hypothetical protein